MLYLYSLLIFLLPGWTDASAAQATVQAAAESELAARFPSLAERLEVRVLRTRLDAEEARAYRIALPPAADVPKARVQVDVEVQADDGAWHPAGWAMLYVAHFDSVMMPRQAIAKDAMVAPDALSPTWIETTRFPQPPLRPADARARQLAYGDLFATRPLREGRALLATDVRGPYAADTGEAVVMQYTRGRIRLDLPARARERGFVGDVIRVFADDTDTMYRVRLTGPGTAVWVETLSR